MLTSIETTPNPNSMKLNVSTDLGAPVTYTRSECADASEFIQALLQIDGVSSVFVCHDFITLNKDPRSDWQSVLDRASVIMNGQSDDSISVDTQRIAAEKLGQVQVQVQTFRGIPIQVKVTDGSGESRVSLGQPFNDAAMSIQEWAGADYLKERYWADYGSRYGDREAVAGELKDELLAIFDESKLQQVVAQECSGVEKSETSIETLKDWLTHEDWQKRLSAVTELSNLPGNVSLLSIALKDKQPQVRRLAAAALGATGSSEGVAPLCGALLTDESAGVRRTAGDALSDIGDVAAQLAMCKALSDPNKLVRWRAARFLSDLGTADALPFLEKLTSDPEFEVRLEVDAAMQRITGGGQGIGPAWKRIIEGNR